MAVRARVELSADVDPAVRSIQRAVNQINKITGGVSKNQVNFNVNGKSFTQPLGRITASANEFTKSLEASNARVIAFGASVGIINGITDSFKFLVAETIRFEKTLKDINVVLNVSNQQLQQFGQGLFDVAQNTAQGFNMAAEAALEFSRQGLSTAEVLKRTNDALTLTRITSLDAAEAVAGLTAAVNAFGKAGLTTTEIIDKLAAVDVKFAVSSEDLINGLERAGAVAIDAGVSLDSLIGIITSLQQTTARGGAVIGNGLKTIFTRIQRPESIRQLERMDIAVRDLTGSILPADTILKNIATSFKNLSQAQQSNVVQFSAGIFQANIFRAALTDLAKAQGIQERALGISANAAGEAARKNELLNKSLSALASQAGTGMKELAGIMGELAFKEDIGGWLELFGKSIEGLKSSLGGGEDEGSTFAKGLVRGIGNVLTGPGMVAFVVIFGKLLTNVFKFASTSLKDVMGIVSEKEKIKKIEESIVKVLGSNKDITEALNELSDDRTAQEKFILGIIERQTNALAEQEKLARRLAPGMRKAGIGEDLSLENHRPTILVDLDGDEHKDSFSAGLNPESRRKEKQGAAKGGYTAGPIAKMNVPGIGGVVYNKAETVKQFPGMKQPAIMPPEQSRAGQNYKRAFGSRHGFDPYASGGFVPNFSLQETWGANHPHFEGSKVAYQEGSILYLPAAKLKTETAHTETIKVPIGIDEKTGKEITKDVTKKITGWKLLKASYINNQINNIKELRNKGLDRAFEELNITDIKRWMFFTDKDPVHENDGGEGKKRVASSAASLEASRAKKSRIGKARRAASNIQGFKYEDTLYKKVLEADDYLETWKGEWSLKQAKETGDPYKRGPGDKDANVDFFKMGHIPLEAKSGKYGDGNLIGKSINLAADSYIEDFLRDKGYDDVADAIMAEKRKESIKLLKSLGKTADDLDASGLSGGLVPNFTKKKPGGIIGKTVDVYRDMIDDLKNHKGTGYAYPSFRALAEKYQNEAPVAADTLEKNLGLTKRKAVPLTETTGWLKRSGLSFDERKLFNSLLDSKIPAGATGVRPKKMTPIQKDVLLDMINGNVTPLEAARLHGHGIDGGSNHSTLKAFKRQLGEYASDKSNGTKYDREQYLRYVHSFGKSDVKDDFKDDRELSDYLGLTFQKGARKPNIDIPAGKADIGLLNAIGLGLGGEVTNWEAKKSLTHLKGKGVRQMLYHHRNAPKGLASIVNSFARDKTSQTKTVDITKEFGGALAIPRKGTSSAESEKHRTSTTLSTFNWKATEHLFQNKFGPKWKDYVKQKKIQSDILVEKYKLPNDPDDTLEFYMRKRTEGKPRTIANLEYEKALGMASQGLIPNFMMFPIFGGESYSRRSTWGRPRRKEEKKDDSIPIKDLPVNEQRTPSKYPPPYHSKGRLGDPLKEPELFRNSGASRLLYRHPSLSSTGKSGIFSRSRNTALTSAIDNAMAKFHGDPPLRSFTSPDAINDYFWQVAQNASGGTDKNTLKKDISGSYYIYDILEDQLKNDLMAQPVGDTVTIPEQRLRNADAQNIHRYTKQNWPGRRGDVSGNYYASGLIPNFVRGLFDFDRMHKAAEVIKNEKTGEWEKTGNLNEDGSLKMTLPRDQRDYIINKIIKGRANIPYDVVHGVPASGKSTWAKQKWPGVEEIRSQQEFDEGNWTEFAVLAGQAPSTTPNDEGGRKDEPRGFLQYSDQARKLFMGAREIFAMTPGKEELIKRRQNRLKEAKEGRLPDSRNSKELARAAVLDKEGNPTGDDAIPDHDLYDQLEMLKRGNVTRIKALGLVPNFSKFDPRLKEIQEFEHVRLHPFDGSGGWRPEPKSGPRFGGKHEKELEALGFRKLGAWPPWEYVGSPKNQDMPYLPAAEGKLAQVLERAGAIGPASLDALGQMRQHDRSYGKTDDGRDAWRAHSDQGNPGRDGMVANIKKGWRNEGRSPTGSIGMSEAVMIMYDRVKNLVQLGEGNHRYAATRIINKELQGTGSYYSTIPAYVQSSDIKRTSATYQDNLNSILWNTMRPPKVPGHAGNPPGVWNPKEFGLHNYVHKTQSAAGLGWQKKERADKKYIGELARGLVPNFARTRTLYRGQRHGQHALADPVPNAPDFLWDKIFAAQTPDDFIQEIENLLVRHARGNLSASYTSGVRPATKEELANPKSLPEGYILHGNDVYERVVKGKKISTHVPSGFVSYSTKLATANQFTGHEKKLAEIQDDEFKMWEDNEEPVKPGYITESKVNESRIFNETKIRKYIKRFGLDKVKEVLRSGGLENIYADLHLWKPRKFSPETFSNPDLDRSIGVKGEHEITRLMSGGLIPNFDDRTRSQKIQDYLADPANKNVKFKQRPPSDAALRKKIERQFRKEYDKTEELTEERMKDIVSGLLRSYRGDTTGYGVGGKAPSRHLTYGTPPNRIKISRFLVNNPDGIGYSRGLIPNFSDPLSDAINRERSAGLAKSQIRVAQDDGLKGPRNPMGLGVINTRDEPLGIKQGIRRARERGIDPKTHGASKGIIPNFASQSGGDNLDANFFKNLKSSLDLFIKSGKEGLSELKDDFKGVFSSQISAGWEAFLDGVEKIDPNNLKQVSNALDSLDVASLDTKKQINTLEKKDTRTADEEKQLQVLKKTDARLATTQKEFTQAKKAGDMAAGTKTENDLRENIDDITETYNQLLESLERRFADETDKGKRGDIEKQHNDLVAEKNKAMIKEKEVTKLSTEAKQGDLQKLFFMSSMIQMVNGQFQELANSTNNVVSNLAKFGEGLGNVVQAQITAKEFGGQLMESVGVDAKSGIGIQNLFDGSMGERKANFKASEMERARKAGPARGFSKIFGPLTKFGRIITRFVPVVGQLYTGFTILNEAFKLINDGEGIMSLFDSGAEKARKKIEKLGKASEATAAALESIKKLEDTKVKLAELEIKGNDRTIKQEGEYLKLQLETLKLEQKQAESINDLTNKNKTGEMGAKLLSEAMKGTTGSLAEQKKALEEVTLRLQAMSAVASINVGFGENMDAAESENSAIALSRVHGANFAALSANKFGDDPKQVQGIADYLTHMLDTGLTVKPEDMGANYDFYDAIDKISTSRLRSFGMDKDNAQILKDELRLMYDAVQDEDDDDIDEDKVMHEGIKSFIKTMTKGMDVSGAMRKLVESTGNARKELERRIVIGKALRSMEQKELDTKDALIKLSNKRAEFENNLLKEAGGLSRSEAVIRDTKLKMLDLDMDQSKKRRDAESKLTEALLDQAQKTLRVENLTDMNEADLNTALANLTKNYKVAADKLKDPKILHQINKGMPGTGIEVEQKDINKAESILNDLAKVAKTGNAGELQSVLNETFLKLEDSQNNMVNILVQSALAMSKGLPLTEENFKTMRASLIERKKALHGLSEERKIKEQEIKDGKTQKGITDRTLQGARDRKKILDQQLITEESILDNLMGEAAYQKVENDYASKEASLRKKSLAYRAMIFEKLRGEVQGNILSEQDESEKLDQTVMLRELRRDPNAIVGSRGVEEAVNNLTEIDALKVKSELTNLKNSRLEAQDRNAFIAIWNQRGSIAKETFLAEQASQENEILNNATLEKHLSIRENRLDAAKRTLILEVQGIQKESQLLNSKIELLKDANYRAYISKTQVDSELKQLKYDNEIEKAKFEYALHTGKLKETAKETAKAEVLALEKDAMLLTLKNEEFQNSKELLKRQQRALSLQDMQNKLSEMRNAQIAASVDQGVLGATVGADMQIEMANQRLGTRTAATRAQLSGRPEDMLAFTEQLKEYNITVRNGTRVIDQLRVKMAEMSVSASNLGSDLVDIGIEGARSGMVELFKSIGSGAEDASEAWKKFSLGIAENLLDRIMQHNVDKIINDLSYAFTGVDPADEANKFLIENNSELSLNTAAIAAQTKVLSDGIRSDTAKPAGTPDEIIARIERMIADIQAKHAALYGSGSPKEKTEQDQMAFLGGPTYQAGQDLVLKLEGLMQSPADIIKSAKPRMEQSANELVNAVTQSLASVTGELEGVTQPNNTAKGVGASGTSSIPIFKGKDGKPIVFEPDEDSTPFELPESPPVDLKKIRKESRLRLLELEKEKKDNPLTAKIHPSVLKMGLTPRGGLVSSRQRGGVRPPEMIANTYWLDLFENTANSKYKFGMRPSEQWGRHEDTEYNINDPESFAKFKGATERARYQLLGQMAGAEKAVTASAKKQKGFEAQLGTDGQLSLEQIKELKRKIDKEKEFQTRFENLRNNLFEEYSQLNNQFLNIRKELKARLDEQRSLEININPEAHEKREALQSEIAELQELLSNQGSRVEIKEGKRDEIVDRLENVKKLYAKEFPEALGGAVAAVEQTLKDLDSDLSNSKDIFRLLNIELNKLKGTLTHLPPAPVETIPELFRGGRIQKFAEGGFVTGPAGRDQVPAMLTAGEYVVPKDEVQKFAPGGRAQAGSTGNWWEEGIFGWNRSNSDHRGTAAMQGFMRMAAMNEVSDLMRDSSGRGQDKPPEFDMKKLNQLNLKSDVSMKRGDRRLSAKALAKDPVMQEYKNYLMDKSAYNVQKTNERYQEKLQRKMAYVQLGQGMIMSAAMDKFVSPVVRKVGDWARSAGDWVGRKTENTVKGHSGLGRHSEEFKEARMNGLPVDYKDIDNFYKNEFDDLRNQGINYSNKAFYNAIDSQKALTTYAHRNGSLHIIDLHPRKNAFSSGGGPFDVQAMNIERSKEFPHQNRGGPIPSMLTAGEGFIPAPIAKRIGYGNLDVMNKTGSLPIVQGPGGIDKVGPVGLSEGDFIIRKSSTDKLMRENPNMMRFALQNPDGFRRGETGYYEGGIVGTGDVTSKSIPSSSGSTAGQPVNRIQPLIEAAEAQQKEKVTHSQNNEVTNNINVNVTIDSSGNETVEAESTQTSYEQEQQLAMKIKSKVIEVIREEKRLGGELDR